MQVQWEEFDPTRCRPRPGGLHGLGLRWEGANLAGQAAERAIDRRAVAALHTCARSLFPSSTVGDGLPAAAEPSENAAIPQGAAPAVTEQETSSIDAAPPRPPVDGDSVLTGRELEIGQLILASLTHKQIEQRLFISAKTRWGLTTNEARTHPIWEALIPPARAGTRPTPGGSTVSRPPVAPG